MDHLDSLRVFVAVAEARSFAAAARKLRLSPSAVTRAVAGLEARLDQAVLARTTRSVRLTERGAGYLDSCRQLLADLDAAERRVRGERAEPSGELVVTAPVVFGRLHVVPVVERLLAAHRRLAIRLVLSDRNAHLVDEGVDVAVRIGPLADSSAIAVKLGAVTRVVVASPRYIEAHGAPRTPADLARHDVIAVDGLDASLDWRFAGAAAVRVAPRLIVNSVDAALAAAESGLGITRALSYQVAAAVRARRLTLLLGDAAPPALPVHVLYPAHRIPSANVAAFVAAARAHIEIA